MKRTAPYLATGAAAAASLIAAQAFAQQAPTAAPAAPSACPAGTQYVPARRDGAGNLIAAYCAAAPTGRGAYDPYTGRGAADPQASPTGGAGQTLAPTR